jgi:purine-cytosine permease-like protein
MTWIGAVLVPVGGVFLAHFVFLRRPIDIDVLYDRLRVPAISVAGVTAWLIGFAVYQLAAPIGATLPALSTAIVVYSVLHRIHIGETRVKS